MEDELQDAPSGWASIELRELVPQARPKIAANPESELPFVGMDHIEPNTFQLVGQERFANMKSAGSYFNYGDVLYGRLRPYLNKVHKARFEGVASAEFIVLPGSEYFDSEFIKYLLHERRFVRFAMSRASGDRPRVKFGAIAEYRFHLPPLNEQRRIVDKIESLFAELDKGEEALRATLKQLERYRQSVLKAAVSGELTADWREENADKLEHGRDLLAKILKKRREQWQGRGKYKEPMKADVSGLPDLPEGWVWASLDQLVGMLKNGLSGKPSHDVNQFPILRISSTRPMKVSTDDMRYYQPRSREEVDQFWVEKGDLLFTRYNGSAHLVGVCGQMRRDTKVLHPDKLIRARPMWTAGLITDYLEIACNTGATRKHIAANIKTTSGQQGLAGSDLRVSPIPLPPADEQAEIAARVWLALGDIYVLQTHCQAELARASALRQSILKEAFSGKLVPQDPDDEPASELLKRFKAKVEGK